VRPTDNLLNFLLVFSLQIHTKSKVVHVEQARDKW